MPTRLNPYLNFRAETRAAMTFYQSVFGGEVSITTFGEGGMPHDPAEADMIMHAQLTGAVEFMAADVPASMDLGVGNSISMAVFGDDDDALSGYFDKLAGGGTTTMPLAMAPWGSKFGMCIDRFGIAWMININVS